MYTVGCSCEINISLTACRRWIYYSLYFGDSVYREVAHFCVLPHHFFALGDMDAIDLIVGDKGLYPMVGRVQLIYYSTGRLCDTL